MPSAHSFYTAVSETIYKLFMLAFKSRFVLRANKEKSTEKKNVCIVTVMLIETFNSQNATYRLNYHFYF